MKTIILFFVTAVIGTGALLASLSMKNPAIGTFIGLGVWALFILYILGKQRRRMKQKQAERLFYQYFIAQQQRRSHY